MTFAHPWVLWLALPPLLALWWAHGRPAARAALSFPASEGFWSAPPSKAALLSRWLPASLKAAAAVLLAVGLARPQKTLPTLGGRGQGIDIMLTVDTSLSMRAEDLFPNRLEAAKDTALRFIRGRVQDRIGLVAFGGAGVLACPLTLDYGALTERLQGLAPGMTRADGTAIGDGIAAAANHLRAGDAKSRVMILLTDGRSNVGGVDPVTAARAAQAFGIKIYAIGAARRGASVMTVPGTGLLGIMPQKVQIEEDLDEGLLTELARLTDGRYFRAENLGQLRDVYATIDKLEKSETRLPPAAAKDDLYRLPVLAAALLLLTQALLSRSLLMRWP